MPLSNPITGIAGCCAYAASGHARCRAAEQRDELAPLHSITSSARASSVGGMVRPSAILRPLVRTITLLPALALGVAACLLVLVVMVRRSYSKLPPPLAGAVV